MINIELRLFANLTEYLPENSENFSIKNNLTIEKLLSQLGIDKDIAKIIFINGKKKNYDHCLKNGDRVGIFPAVGGG